MRCYVANFSFPNIKHRFLNQGAIYAGGCVYFLVRIISGVRPHGSRWLA